MGYNTHYSGIGYWNGVLERYREFINFEGYKEILWDNAVFGPLIMVVTEQQKN